MSRETYRSTKRARQSVFDDGGAGSLEHCMRMLCLRGQVVFAGAARAARLQVWLQPRPQRRKELQSRAAALQPRKKPWRARHGAAGCLAGLLGALRRDRAAERRGARLMLAADSTSGTEPATTSRTPSSSTSSSGGSVTVWSGPCSSHSRARREVPRASLSFGRHRSREARQRS